jgi:hypothetical protein
MSTERVRFCLYGVRRIYVCTYDSSESIQYILKFASQPDFYYIDRSYCILHTGWKTIRHTSPYPMEQDDRSIHCGDTHRHILLFLVLTIRGFFHAMDMYLICLDFIGLRLVCPETCHGQLNLPQYMLGQWKYEQNAIPQWPLFWVLAVPSNLPYLPYGP